MSSVLKSPYMRLNTYDGLIGQEYEKYKCFNFWIFNFYKIFKDNLESDELIMGIKPKDVVHAIAGLFLASLQSMSKTSVYDTLSRKNSYSIVCFADLASAASHIQRNLKPNTQIGIQEELKPDTIASLSSCMDAIYFEPNKKSDDKSENDKSDINDFKLVYPSEFSNSSSEGTSPLSDETGVLNSSSSDHNENSFRSSCSESGEENPKLKCGYQSFIGACIGRRLMLSRLVASMHVETDVVNHLAKYLSAENLVVAACTFRKRRHKKNQRIIHLNLLAVRRHLRRQKLGSIMLRYLKRPDISGYYDALIVHADLDAVGFFEKHGFTDDILLNHFWEDFTSEYKNCKIMTYVPGYSDQYCSVASCSPLPEETNCGSWIKKLDVNIREWQHNAQLTHRNQYVLYRKMRNEIIELQNLVKLQGKHISELYKELQETYTTLLRLQSSDAGKDDSTNCGDHPARVLMRLKEVEEYLATNITKTSTTSPDQLCLRRLSAQTIPTCNQDADICREKDLKVESNVSDETSSANIYVANGLLHHGDLYTIDS
ncbi:unnamed protein product [Dicrocoelium dendriticum]|nr:unnamed protein product [Dicrocoelium dendriticum]